jgi:hypothetical protein
MIFMRKSRVEIACGMFAIIMVISVIASCLILSGNGQYVPKINDYSSYEIAVYPPSTDFTYPLANYSLVRSSGNIGLFDRVGLAHFESGIEFYEGLTNITHTDIYGRLDIHETPSTVLEYEAYETNTLKFDMTIGTGAIKKGSSVVVGSENAGGVFVMLGGATSTINGQEVQFNTPANSKVIFRTDTSQDNVIGSAVAEDRIAAEMYLLDAGWTIGEDVVSFDNTQMYTVAASEDVVEVQVTGDSLGKAVVIHVTEPYLAYGSVEDISVKLDGESVVLGAGMSETLWAVGEESTYFATKTADGFDIVVYMPQNSDSVISITAAETPLGVDGMVTLLAAIGIVGVAVVALIKTND